MANTADIITAIDSPASADVLYAKAIAQLDLADRLAVEVIAHADPVKSIAAQGIRSQVARYRARCEGWRRNDDAGMLGRNGHGPAFADLLRQAMRLAGDALEVAA